MKVLSTMDVLPVFLLLLSVGISSLIAAERTCRRRAPPFTDCSSTTGECNFRFDSNDLPRALPFPPPNTRTCYRTCHDRDGVCRSVPTGVDEQRLQISSANANSKVYRIFSPNFGRGNYRKSTICRYRVQCDPGQIISYSVLEFDLEESNTCSSQTHCLDYVEIYYQNLGTRQRFCGGGENGEVHPVGSNELTFEFVSNRLTEKSGFEFFVNCIDSATGVNRIGDNGAPGAPGLQPIGQPNGIIGGTGAPGPQPLGIPNNRIGNFIINPPCTQPPNMAPRPLPFAITAPSTTVTRYVVEMFGFINYNRGCIFVYNAQRQRVNTIRGIFCLKVTNRFRTVRRYSGMSIGATFNGYGILEVDDGRANFNQQGADPVFQPTPEESSSIIELERTINMMVGPDFFDVVDKYDILPSDEPILPSGAPVLPSSAPILDLRRPQRLRQRFRPRRLIPQRLAFRPLNIPQRITQMAAEYGNACNAVLRSTACAYQALLLGVDCNTGLALN